MSDLSEVSPAEEKVEGEDTDEECELLEGLVVALECGLWLEVDEDGEGSVASLRVDTSSAPVEAAPAPSPW